MVAERAEAARRSSWQHCRPARPDPGGRGHAATIRAGSRKHTRPTTATRRRRRRGVACGTKAADDPVAPIEDGGPTLCRHLQPQRPGRTRRWPLGRRDRPARRGPGRTRRPTLTDRPSRLSGGWKYLIIASSSEDGSASSRRGSTHTRSHSSAIAWWYRKRSSTVPAARQTLPTYKTSWSALITT